MSDIFVRFYPNLDFVNRFFFVEVPNIKFHGNPSNGYRADHSGQTDRRTYSYEEGNLGAFRDYANAPSNKRTRSYVNI